MSTASASPPPPRRGAAPHTLHAPILTDQPSGTATREQRDPARLRRSLGEPASEPELAEPTLDRQPVSGLQLGRGRARGSHLEGEGLRERQHVVVGLGQHAGAAADPALPSVEVSIRHAGETRFELVRAPADEGRHAAVDEARNDRPSILPSVTGSDGMSSAWPTNVTTPSSFHATPPGEKTAAVAATPLAGRDLGPSRASPPPPPHAPSRKPGPVSSTRADQLMGRGAERPPAARRMGRRRVAMVRPCLPARRRPPTVSSEHAPSRPASPPRPRAPGGSRRRRRRGPARCPATPGVITSTRGVLLQERASPWLVVGERHQVLDVEGLHRRPGTDVPGCVRWLHCRSCLGRTKEAARCDHVLVLHGRTGGGEGGVLILPVFQGRVRPRCQGDRSPAGVQGREAHREEG